MQNKIILLIMPVLVFAAVLVSSCDRRREHIIRYEVTGSASSVDITLNNSKGHSEDYRNITLPYSKTISVTLKEFDLFYAYVAAKNRGSSGYVQCTIYKNDRIVAEDEAWWPYTTASAYATIER
jgi:hypothetical protein